MYIYIYIFIFIYFLLQNLPNVQIIIYSTNFITLVKYLIFISQGSIYDTANVSCSKRTIILVVSVLGKTFLVALILMCLQEKIILCPDLFCVVLNLLDVFSHCKSSPDFLFAQAAEQQCRS